MTVEQADRHDRPAPVDRDGDAAPVDRDGDPTSVVRGDGPRTRPADRGRWRRRAVLGAVVGVLLGAVGVALQSWRLAPDASTIVVRADLGVRDTYVANPGMGWQDTSREPRFAETVEYIRPTGGWAALNPAPGVYDWSLIDEALDGAAQRGNLASLRIYTMRHPRFDGHRLPAWVIDDGATLIDGEPDYSNAVYQDRWATFVEALRARYDGDPRIAFIDVSGYGNYNEWSWQDQTGWDTDWRSPTSLDGQARTRLADMFLGGSGTVEVRDADGDVSTVAYSYPGFARTQLVMPYAGIRQSLWYALQRRPDVGWRFDCLGQISADELRDLGDDALQRWRQAPVVFEFCSSVDWSDVDDAIALTHPVLLHDNGTAAEPELPAVLADVGYRYVLDRAEWQRNATAGGWLPLRMSWRNDGSSLAYETLGVVPVLHAALIDATGAVAHDWTVTDDVGGWLPGAPVPVQAELDVPADLAPGGYDLRVSMRNARSGRPLALPMRDVTDDGWVPLGRLRVTDR